MSNILEDREIEQFNEDGAILLKNKFDKNWINKLRAGIDKAKANPSPRFTNHTKDKNSPSYLCLLYTSPSPRDGLLSRMPSSA